MKKSFVIEDHFERQAKKDGILELMRSGDWKRVLDQFDDGYREPLLVWIRPSMGLLRFFRETLVQQLGFKHILSIGCGCGFLEWLISEAVCDLSISGLEVNSSWWESRHATPHFISLEYTMAEDSRVPPNHDNSALMFCYFNHLEYFHKYLDSYGGNCVILIGPIDGQRHCDPEPDYLAGHEFVDQWQLFDRHDIRDAGEDAVAIYIRKKRI